MYMFARFDVNPAMTLQDIKNTKRYGWTHGRTDNEKTVYPPQTKFAGGIKICFQDPLSLNAGQKYCRMLQESILQYLTFIKLPLVFKTCYVYFRVALLYSLLSYVCFVGSDLYRLLSYAFFFKIIKVFKNFLQQYNQCQNTTKCQTVWIQIRPNILPSQTWVWYRLQRL